MSIAIVTPAYTTHSEEWSVLRESAVLCGASLHVVNGGGYNPLKSIEDIAGLVKQLTDEYIVSTDAYDTMMCRWDANAIANAVDSAAGGLLVSCESSCYPPGEWCASYGQPQSEWWYPNGGQMAGTRDAMLQLWHEYLSGKWPVEHGGGTQEMLHRMHASGYQFTRDVFCNVFQSMAGMASQHVHCDNGIVSNYATGSKPLLLHFNGRTEGLKAMYERWREKR